MPSILRIVCRRRPTPRRAFAHALLILALLLTQLGAFTHALSHVPAPDAAAALLAGPADTGAGDAPRASHHEDGACALCSAFTGTAAALFDHDTSVQPVLESLAVVTGEARFLAHFPFFSFSSRAPPSLA